MQFILYAWTMFSCMKMNAFLFLVRDKMSVQPTGSTSFQDSDSYAGSDSSEDSDSSENSDSSEDSDTGMLK